MIAYLQGQIISQGSNYLVVLANQIGYKVFVTTDLAQSCSLGQDIALHIHQQVKENEIALFGFLSPEELELFELLISVSGIGPKSGLNIFLVAGVEDIKQAIIINDPSLLTKVSGIGKKTAERIVLELKNKIVGRIGDVAVPGSAAAVSEEIDALMQLGYSLPQAREALQKIDPSITDSAQRIKQALSNL